MEIPISPAPKPFKKVVALNWDEALTLRYVKIRVFEQTVSAFVKEHTFTANEVTKQNIDSLIGQLQSYKRLL